MAVANWRVTFERAFALLSVPVIRGVSNDGDTPYNLPTKPVGS